MIKKIIQFVPGVAVPMVTNFVLTMLYAAYLEPGQYGILNVYLNTIQIVYAISTSVFQNASLRFYSLRELYNNDEDFIGSYLAGNIIVTLAIVPLGLLVNFFFKFNWWIIVLSIGCNSPFQFMCNWFRLVGDSRKYNFLRAVSAGLSVLLFMLFTKVVFPFTYIWPIIAVYGSYGILTLASLKPVAGKIQKGKIQIKLLLESVRYALPLIGVTVLGYIVASCDQYFLLYYLGDVAVGNYALGHRLVDALVINLLMMVLLVMTPELNKRHDLEGEKESSITLKNMMSAAQWIIFPVSFAIIVYADYIIQYIFPAYPAASQIMKLVVFASIFHGISMFTCKGLELVKRPKYIFYGLAISTVINCLYNALFIPIYGIDASAHSSLIAYLFYNIWLVSYSKKYYQFTFDWKYSIFTVISTVVTAIFAIVLMKVVPIGSIITLCLEGLSCMFVYLCASYFFKLFKVWK